MIYPPRSPLGLIQEDLFPSEWLILVSCVLLNCTSRRQVEKIIDKFVSNWHSPELLLLSDPETIKQTIASLGFKERRTQRLIQLAKAYKDTDWSHASELPGIGAYGARAWEIFALGKLGTVEPNDSALSRYWRWAIERQKRQEKTSTTT